MSTLDDLQQERTRIESLMRQAQQDYDAEQSAVRERNSQRRAEFWQDALRIVIEHHDRAYAARDAVIAACRTGDAVDAAYAEYVYAYAAAHELHRHASGYLPDDRQYTGGWSPDTLDRLRAEALSPQYGDRLGREYVREFTRDLRESLESEDDE